jgi:hypothetical protein
MRKRMKSYEDYISKLRKMAYMENTGNSRDVYGNDEASKFLSEMQKTKVILFF